MYRKLLFGMAVIAAASLVSCGGSGDKKDGGDKKDTTATKTTENKAPTGAKYAMKSGIIDLKSTMMGMEQKVTMYFDDFGKKEASVLTMEMMGMKTESRTIKKDGYSYDINMTKKECTKKKLPGTGDPNDLNFKDMSADMMKKMSIKKEGNERFLGIYELSGGILRICLAGANAARPTRFVDAPNLVILVLSRTAPTTFPVPPTPNVSAAIIAAKTDITNLETALDAFEIDTGRYPTSAEGLAALGAPPAGIIGWHGPYIRALPNDP